MNKFFKRKTYRKKVEAPSSKKTTLEETRKKTLLRSIKEPFSFFISEEDHYQINKYHKKLRKNKIWLIQQHADLDHYYSIKCNSNTVVNRERIISFFLNILYFHKKKVVKEEKNCKSFVWLKVFCIGFCINWIMKL